MAYHVTVKASALKSLAKIPRATRERLLEKITHLADEPRPAGCPKLAGPDHLWRVRVGDYRVVYVIDDLKKLVDVRIVAHRREVYRDL